MEKQSAENKGQNTCKTYTRVSDKQQRMTEMKILRTFKGNHLRARIRSPIYWSRTKNT